MFLTSNELGLEDFLKAISFIPPKGTTVEYFISPKEINGATSGFQAEVPAKKEYDDNTVTYQRIDPATKIVQGDTPTDYANITPVEMPATGPKIPVMPQTTPIEALECPYAKVLSDDELGTDVILTENFGPFYKNTLFHCKRLNEKTLSSLTPRMVMHYSYSLRNVPICSYNGYGMDIQEVTQFEQDYWKIMGYIGGPYASQHVDVIYDEEISSLYYAETRHVDVTHEFDNDKVKQFIEAFKRIVDIDTLKNQKTNTGMVQIPSDQSKELQRYCKEEIK